MNAQEIKEIIEALAPAGQAVNSTAALFVIKEMLHPILLSITTITVVYMVLRAIRLNNEREDADNIAEKLERVLDRSSEATKVIAEEGELLKEAFNRFKDRNSTRGTNRWGQNCYVVKKEKMEALIKYLEEN